jgi:FecR protein
MRALHKVSGLIAAAFILVTAPGALAADGDDWTVSKSSGEVWLTSSGVQQASLKQEDLLKPGETVRTGRNGRVLLRRGEETILIAPNSVVGVPAQKKEGLSTTIVQQAGSILLEVEKRNVRHFEVETPYLAAVVKGTQFRVTIKAGSTSVDVIRGQVQVSDFKSGQIAQVMAGQHATAFANGKAGLSLSGSGRFIPIEQGTPRAPTIDRVPVQRAGLSAARQAANGQKPHGVTRIASSIGEVRLNVHRATQGLARGTSAADRDTQNAARRNTIWSESRFRADTASANNGQGNGGNAAAAATGAAAAGVSSTVATVSGSNGGGNGNGNNGNGSGANGNGRGNANAYGHYKNR